MLGPHALRAQKAQGRQKRRLWDFGDSWAKKAAIAATVHDVKNISKDATNRYVFDHWLQISLVDLELLVNSGSALFITICCESIPVRRGDLISQVNSQHVCTQFKHIIASCTFLYYDGMNPEQMKLLDAILSSFVCICSTFFQQTPRNWRSVTVGCLGTQTWMAWECVRKFDAGSKTWADHIVG